jgi:hypothetical protein
LNPRDLDIFFNRVKDSRCSASLRVDGTSRMLGQLLVRGLESGVAIQLGGLKVRDRLPAAGTVVSLNFLLDDEVVSLRTVMMEPLAAPEGRQRPRVLRVAWPTQPLECHHRDDLRVAAPELPPLGATLVFRGRRLEAKLVNLTETGMGLALREVLPVLLQEGVEVETLLPGGLPLLLEGDVRHWEELEAEDPLPFRVGLVLRGIRPEVREALRRMIQARRIIRSEGLREG